MNALRGRLSQRTASTTFPSRPQGQQPYLERLRLLLGPRDTSASGIPVPEIRDEDLMSLSEALFESAEGAPKKTSRRAISARARPPRPNAKKPRFLMNISSRNHASARRAVDSGEERRQKLERSLSRLEEEQKRVESEEKERRERMERNRRRRQAAREAARQARRIESEAEKEEQGREERKGPEEDQDEVLLRELQEMLAGRSGR